MAGIIEMLRQGVRNMWPRLVLMPGLLDSGAVRGHDDVVDLVRLAAVPRPFQRPSVTKFASPLCCPCDWLLTA
jgi:hypothetical protein